ncbi:MAG: MerR family transcriptional regulator [Nitrospirae bacterium]|nr:MerR family transcriptional regulator [Nitrospirota bacterium]
MDRQALTIRQLAKEGGVSAKTLRHWEGLGLIRPSRRTHANYRVYTRSDLDRVLFILKAKSLGFTLAEIGRVFDLARTRTAPCDAVMKWAAERTKSLEEQIQMLKDLKKRLERYRKRWASGIPVGRLGANEVCRCIASVSEEEARRSTQAPRVISRRSGKG